MFDFILFTAGVLSVVAIVFAAARRARPRPPAAYRYPLDLRQFEPKHVRIKASRADDPEHDIDTGWQPVEEGDDR